MVDKNSRGLLFKSRKQCRLIIGITVIMLGISLLICYSESLTWNVFNHKLLDAGYRLSVRYGYGPSPSIVPGIVYLLITDKTYDHFGKNILDREDLVPINMILQQYRTEGIIYDIIFSRASNEKSDQAFADSIQAAGNVYLPIALAMADQATAFHWKQGKAYERIRTDFSGIPAEKNQTAAHPFYASNAMTQVDLFASQTARSGHITIQADVDSIYRHITLLVKVDNQYYPALPMAVFMHHAGICMTDLTVVWGHHLTIAATTENGLEQDLSIPIDKRGRLFIPYVQTLGNDFSHMTAHQLLTQYQTPHLRGNLQNFFEGQFVFIADIATGASDLGYTPLDKDTPLTTINTAVLNALLTRTFYWKWSRSLTTTVVICLVLWFGAAAVFRHSWLFYGSGFSLPVLLLILTGLELINFRLVPAATIGGISCITFLCLLITLEISSAREKKIIRTIFSRYMPEKLVKKLLEQPEMVSLGGQEQTVTILFSDLAGFTSITETLAPTVLVQLLNDYFSEMVPIIQDHNGIIDKFQGDGIMAEFGIPLPLDRHADQAVSAALDMLKRLTKLQKKWQDQGLPAPDCRIGINTGRVVVGNMGSRTVMDYTVMGDAVNLASRLESANKYYGTRLMISEYTMACLSSDTFHIRLLDFVRVKGKNKPVRVYEVYGRNLETSSPDSDLEKGYRIYDKAVTALLDKQFPQALLLFQQAASLCPDDSAAAAMVDRVKKLLTDQLRGDVWDPSTALEK